MAKKKKKKRSKKKQRDLEKKRSAEIANHPNPKIIVNTPKHLTVLYKIPGAVYPLELARSGRAFNKYQFSLLEFLLGLNLDQPGYWILDNETLKTYWCDRDSVLAHRTVKTLRRQRERDRELRDTLAYVANKKAQRAIARQRLS